MRALAARFRRRLGNWPRRHHGVSSVEFAIIAPVVLTIALGAFDLGRAVSLAIQLEEAARSGTLYAARAPGDGVGIRAAVDGNLVGQVATVNIGAARCECAAVVAACDTFCSTGMARFMTIQVSASFAGYLYPRSATITGDATILFQ